MGEIRPRCPACGEVLPLNGLPDWSCWDGEATETEVREWVERLRVGDRGPARFLTGIVSREAAATLRQYLDDPDPAILAMVAGVVGGSGDESDESALVRLLDHDDEKVRIAAARSLAELEPPGAAPALRARLESTEAGREHDAIVRALAWVRDASVLPELRSRLEADGPHGRIAGRFQIAESLARVGDLRDRARMAELAAEELQRAADAGYTDPQYRRSEAWDAYARAVGLVAPGEVEAARAGLSAAAALALTHHPYTPPTEEDVASGHGPRTVPRRSMRFGEQPPEGAARPMTKFLGQPNWLEEPTWPLAPDGFPLNFYGQLELCDGRVAYIFIGPPGSTIGETDTGWTPVIVQPGPAPNVPTVPRSTGPIFYDWASVGSRFVGRLRRVPSPENFVTWVDGFDPVEYRSGGALNRDDTNKVGGTPAWLQGERDLGSGWSWVFQFDAGLAGRELADGAVVYGFLHEDGHGTVGWDSH